MRTRFANAALWVFTLLVIASSANAQQFEGRILQTISSPVETEKMEMVMNFKNGKMMASADLGAQGSAKIYMLDESNVTVVLGGQNMGMQIPMPKQDLTANADAAPLMKSTGKKETINGYATEEWVGEMGDGLTMSLWLTGDVEKSVMKAMELAMRTQSASNPGSRNDEIERFLAQKGMMPVRTVISANGEVAAIVDVTKIEKTKLADSLFEIPSDITIQKMDDMFQGGESDGQEDGHEGHGH